MRRYGCLKFSVETQEVPPSTGASPIGLLVLRFRLGVDMSDEELRVTCCCGSTFLYPSRASPVHLPWWCHGELWGGGHVGVHYKTTSSFVCLNILKIIGRGKKRSGNSIAVTLGPKQSVYLGTGPNSIDLIPGCGRLIRAHLWSDRCL